MKSPHSSILTINGGSSSIKFALYQTVEPIKRCLYGKIDRIGLVGANLTFVDLIQNQPGSSTIKALDHQSAANVLVDWLDERIGFTSIKAIGHRVVYGTKSTEPYHITQGH